MAELDRAIAAARPVADDGDEYQALFALRDLLAALDAARGEAAAWVLLRDGARCGAFLEEQTAKAFCLDDPKYTYCAAYAAPAAALAVPEAMRVVTAAMRSDPEYAWSWHCNVAMAFVDEGGDHAMANHAAARFMRLLANVEPAHEIPAKPAQQPAASVPATHAIVPRELPELVATYLATFDMDSVGHHPVDAALECWAEIIRFVEVKEKK